MSSRTQDVIYRHKSRLARIEWNLSDFSRQRENAADSLARTWWQAVRSSIAVAAFGVVLVGVGFVLLASHLHGGPEVSFFFIGGGFVVAGALWLAMAADERSNAPRILDFALKQIVENEAEKLAVIADLERAQKRQRILSDDTLWVGEKMEMLATAAGLSKDEVARIENVFGAVAEDLVA